MNLFEPEIDKFVKSEKVLPEVEHTNKLDEDKLQCLG